MNPPFPPSFDGSPLLYTWALGSITALACLMVMVAGWMARDIWRDRYYVHPKTALTAFRAILMVAATTSFMRSLPEAVYMYSWNEVTPETNASILYFKRIADGVSIAPGAGWTTLLLVAYPSIANALKSQAHIDTVNPDLWSPWPGLVRPALMLVLIFLIAFLVATSKLYTGMQVGDS